MKMPTPPTAPRRALVLLALLCGGAVWLEGCDHNQTPPTHLSEPYTMPSTDLAELGRLIHLPVPPRAVTFEKATLGHGGAFGPTDWELIAVLDYDPAAIKQLDLRPPEQEPERALTFYGREVRPWFPPEVKATFQPAEGGDSRCQGEGFDAAPFARSPLLQGVIAVPQGTHYLVLRMQTS